MTGPNSSRLFAICRLPLTYVAGPVYRRPWLSLFSTIHHPTPQAYPIHSLPSQTGISTTINGAARHTSGLSPPAPILAFLAGNRSPSAPPARTVADPAIQSGAHAIHYVTNLHLTVISPHDDPPQPTYPQNLRISAPLKNSYYGLVCTSGICHGASTRITTHSHLNPPTTNKPDDRQPLHSHSFPVLDPPTSPAQTTMPILHQPSGTGQSSSQRTTARDGSILSTSVQTVPNPNPARHRAHTVLSAQAPRIATADNALPHGYIGVPTAMQIFNLHRTMRFFI